ncbi:MAG: hypothetical protein ACJ780_31500 [Solirubrobacteraceae bacterium]|jgi:hypothetical protein
MPKEEVTRYDLDFESLAEAERHLNHINLRRHRGNPEVRAAVHAARAAVIGATEALMAVEDSES